MYKNHLKYLIEFVLAFLALVILCPLFLATCIVLLIANRGSVFFTQIRPGKNEKPFKLIKFKTMSDRKNSAGDLLPDAARLTAVGRWIRKLSIDEIPQLINVIKGEMAIVGPRPLLMEYLDLYNTAQKQRHDMRPGITGWAQVNGRNTIQWEKKFEYDVWYVTNCTFFTDVKILFMTVFKVLKVEGISSETSVTMEKFTGTTK